ncbi:MAG: hypothetical protein GKR95_11680, partial [Gammaproteobacteria bacterium]|nr:hypothetical protein [Gammaproteobacteria bacterium]
PKSIWQKLNLSWSIFFLVLGLINLYVAFYYNLDADQEVRTQTWVNFKVFGLMGLTLAFTVIQMLFLARHIDPKSNPDSNSNSQSDSESGS